MKFNARSPLIALCAAVFFLIAAAAVYLAPPPTLTVPPKAVPPAITTPPPPDETPDEPPVTPTAPPPAPPVQPPPPTTPPAPSPEESPQPSPEPEPEPEPDPSPEPTPPEPVEPEPNEPEPSPEPSPEPTEPPAPFAPDFTVTDRDGNLVRLSDFRGTPVVVNFWSLWSPLSLGDLPNIEAVWRTYGGAVVFMAINIVDKEAPHNVVQYLDGHQFTFPAYFDTEGNLATAAYAVTRLPTTVWINADGSLFATRVGTMSQSMMEERILQLLS